MPTSFREYINNIIQRMYTHPSVAEPNIWFPLWQPENSSRYSSLTSSASSSTSSPPQQSPGNGAVDHEFAGFTKLPIELRFEIYALAAFSQDIVRTVGIHADRAGARGHFAVHTQYLMNSADRVAQTCREARYEIKRLSICLPTSFLYHFGTNLRGMTRRHVMRSHYFNMGRSHYHRDTRFFLEERDALEIFYHLSIRHLAVYQLHWLRHLMLDDFTFELILRKSDDLFHRGGAGAPFDLLPNLRTITVAFILRAEHDVAMLEGPYGEMTEELKIRRTGGGAGMPEVFNISHTLGRFHHQLSGLVIGTVSRTRKHVVALEQRGVKVIWGAINSWVFRRPCHAPLAQWPDNWAFAVERPDGGHVWLSDRHRYLCTMRST